MLWSLVGIALNSVLLGMFHMLEQRAIISLEKEYVHIYVGIIVEVILLVSNTITIWGLEEGAACVFGYLLSSKQGFSMAVCGYLQASPTGKLRFAQSLALTSPSRKILTRLSFLWIITELQIVLSPFSAISIRAEPSAVYNDISDCIYFVQDNKTKPVDRKWPNLDAEGGVSEYVFGSSLGIMRSEVPGVAMTTAMYPPQLISALNDGDTIKGLGFSADISTVCKCASGLTPDALSAAGVDISQANQILREFQKLSSEPGMTFGTTFFNNSIKISNVFSGYGLCGGKGPNLIFPLVCSTTINNHQTRLLEIQFMTDGTTASIAPNIVNSLEIIGEANIETWLYFGMNAITNGPVSSFLTTATVPGSLSPLLWWTTPNLIGADRAIFESGIETMYAILFKAAIQRTYTARGAQCPRKNTIHTTHSVIFMEPNGYKVTAVFLTIQLIVSILSTFSFILWFTAPSPIGPAVRATQESIYLITLMKTSERVGIGLYDLCNAETYYIWQKLDFVCRIGESIATIDDEVGKITIDKASMDINRKMKSYVLLTVLVLAVAVAAKLTEAEKKILREAANEADKHIRQVTPSELPAFISTGYHLLFYGAVWCRLTQRFTTKWLEIQDEFDRRGWNTVPGFGIAKVQCANEHEEFCHQTMNIHEGYPTINLYFNGQLLEEYTHKNERDDIIRYLEHTYDLVKTLHIGNNEHAEIIAEVEKPKEEGPKRKPVHHQFHQIEHLDEDMLDLDAVEEGVYEKELVHKIAEYNEELSWARISAVLVLSIACLIVVIFSCSHARSGTKAGTGNRRYQQVTDRSDG
ncbi:UNVERIFIED_CONTAM: hypothetical protein HDU68_000532 [Siphonaria sp. JEL0065]|nr:hypothetical protein HDU68_000532 [Siphonaria sp. JEL0065]